MEKLNIGSVIGLRRYKPSPENQAAITAQSANLANHFEFKGFDHPFNVFGQWTQVEPSPEAFANLLLTMGYLEGGEEETYKVNSFISKRGIEISPSERGFAAGGVTFRRKGAIKVGFTGVATRRFLESYCFAEENPSKSRSAVSRFVEDIMLSARPTIFAHEFYHVIQGAYKRRVASFLDFTVWIASAEVTALMFYNRPTDSDFASRIVLAVAAGICSAHIVSAFLSPTELSAYLRTEIPSPWRLTTDPTLTPIQRQLFSKV